MPAKSRESRGESRSPTKAVSKVRSRAESSSPVKPVRREATGDYYR